MKLLCPLIILRLQSSIWFQCSQQVTNLTEGSFAVMRRRSPSQGGFTAEKRITRYGFQTAITIDNRWVVPYCPFLLRQFKSHLNVEMCSTVSSIKYVLKYTFKGQDRAACNLESTDSPIDEISDYENKRYIINNNLTLSNLIISLSVAWFRQINFL